MLLFWLANRTRPIPWLASKVYVKLYEKLMIGMVVGTPPHKLYAAIGINENHCYIVRAMLNIAAELGGSMTDIENTNVPSEYAETTNWIFLQLGKTATVALDLYDVGGVLAGCPLSCPGWHSRCSSQPRTQAS